VTAVSVTEFGRRIGVSRAVAYRLVASGGIETVNVGSGATPRLRVTEDAIAAYLKRRKIPAKAA
jgi:predicted site-specific integrase-resolvase